MQITDKVKVGVYLSPVVQRYLKVFAFNNNKNMSDVVEKALLFSLENPAFLEGLKEK
jgi:hypothetical protein